MSALASPQAVTTKWNIDPVHTVAEFKVKHMMVSNVKGDFDKVTGSIVLDDADPSASSINVTVDVASIDTNESNRDGHLQSPEFFDSQKHPQITFTSSSVETDSEGSLNLTGEITIKGITKPITLTGTLGENGEDPWGHQRVGFEVSGVIDRRDFDLAWNQALPNGNLLVANDVRLVVSVSAVKA